VLRAVVLDETGVPDPDAPVFAYRWSTTGLHGKLRDAAGHDSSVSGGSFESSDEFVTYLHGGSTYGTDLVQVEVIDPTPGRGRPVIGRANATVRSLDREVTLAPRRSSVRVNERITFTAKLENAAPADLPLTYRWSTSGRLGGFEGGPQDFTSTEASQVWRAWSDRPGTETVTVHVTGAVGAPFGSATAEVRLNEPRRSIVFGSYRSDVEDWTDSRGNPRCNVISRVYFPKVPGAKYLDVNCYNFYDAAYWGPSYRTAGDPRNPPSGWADLGDEFHDGISGYYGGDAESCAGSVEAREVRFGGMIVEVTVTYEDP
jgi:hypothetical protein